MSTTLTIRIDDKTKERLERLAAATARSKSYLVSAAINEFIEANEWQIRAIEKAVKSADKGHFVDHEEVVKWVESWGTTEELEPPKCK
ncbi:MAG: CopG family ribbon-helix-helix protein [Candidatus Brocadia sp.]|nr:CopG family ribbon-helix-helix protein [Candidatus Brocadia sp.]